MNRVQAIVTILTIVLSAGLVSTEAHAHASEANDAMIAEGDVGTTDGKISSYTVGIKGEISSYTINETVFIVPENLQTTTNSRAIEDAKLKDWTVSVTWEEKNTQKHQRSITVKD